MKPSFGLLTSAVIAAVVAAVLAGCAVNPVTGETEFSLISPAEEIEIGRRQFGPAQQMQGGQYRADPVLTEYVREVGNRLAAQAPRTSGASLPYEFVVLNNSVPNAWALPGGKIAINRGLLTELNSEAELAAVLGHEIAHAAARHGAQQASWNILLQGTLGAVALGTSDSTVVGAAQLGSNLITRKYGRDAEREADLYGTRFMAAAGYDPQAAVVLQETFVRLSQGGRQDFVSGLFSSHPPSVERVEKNRALVASLRREGYTGGEVGRASFEVAMAHLRSARAAYEAYDAALKALAEGHEQAADEKISLALEIEPADAMLHGFRGDIRYLQNRYADAMINYDRAITLDAEFYRYYLMRGLARVDLDGRSGMPEARADLERSLKLLQTAVAHLALGKIAEARGDDENAYAHYAEAGSAQTEVGREARERARVLLERRRSYGARS